ncbi:MAG TPA: hypothetical protein VHM89_03935 [Acidimicrobiales bacterium]|nr:hypothetical protein [Acidimicrobiales bacterium]
MNLRRLAITAAVVATPLGTVLAGPAHADPSKYPPDTVTCDELGTFDIATNGNGAWTPAHATDSTRVLVPYRFHFEFTPVGGTTEAFDQVKPAPKNGRLDFCTFGGTDEEGTFSGSAWVSYTPVRG